MIGLVTIVTLIVGLSVGLQRGGGTDSSQADKNDSTVPNSAFPTPSPAGYAVVDTSSETMLDIIETSPALSPFELIMTFSDFDFLRELLADPNIDVTLFAPNAVAIATLPGEMISKFSSAEHWVPHVESLLLYHVLPTRLFSPVDFEGTTVLTANELDSVVLTGGHVNNITIVTPNINASNGVVHIIDQVLLPPAVTIPLLEWLRSMPEISIFTSLVERLPSMEDRLLNMPGPMTVYAPVDAAFDALDPGVWNTFADEELILTHIWDDSVHHSSDCKKKEPAEFMDGTERWVSHISGTVTVGTATSTEAVSTVCCM